MNFAEAITRKMIVPSVVDGQRIWLCGKCNKYLVYYFNRYHYTCECFEKELEAEHEHNHESIPQEAQAFLGAPV